MKLLCYRGAFYKRVQRAIELVSIERFPSVPQSTRVLCYRGVFYLRETHTAPNSEPASLQIVQHHSVQSGQSNERTMQSDRMGSLYKLYCIGWRNGSIKQFSQLQHGLLSLFFYYRRGFAEAVEWRQNQVTDPALK